MNPVYQIKGLLEEQHSLYLQHKAEVAATNAKYKPESEKLNVLAAPLQEKLDKWFYPIIQNLSPEELEFRGLSIEELNDHINAKYHCVSVYRYGPTDATQYRIEVFFEFTGNHSWHYDQAEDDDIGLGYSFDLSLDEVSQLIESSQ